eukprot:Em0001g791a
MHLRGKLSTRKKWDGDAQGRVVGKKWLCEKGRFLKVAAQTAVDWYNFIRDICAQYFIDHPSILGGPGVEVEIDESKFGKRKYNRGRQVEGHWVFGGTERITGECFLLEVEHRDAATLLPLIQQYIRPGSVVFSDEWAAYRRITQTTGMTHQTVNHSIHFVDPATGAHTQGVEEYCQMEMGTIGTHLAGTQSSPEVPELQLTAGIAGVHFPAEARSLYRARKWKRRAPLAFRIDRARKLRMEYITATWKEGTAVLNSVHGHQNVGEPIRFEVAKKVDIQTDVD